jgi:hypothetical protein
MASKPTTTQTKQAQVPVYEWVLDGNVSIGCGTKLEFDFWTLEGVVTPGTVLGKILTYEPASENERRKRLWMADKFTTEAGRAFLAEVQP